MRWNHRNGILPVSINSRSTPSLLAFCLICLQSHSESKNHTMNVNASLTLWSWHSLPSLLHNFALWDGYPVVSFQQRLYSSRDPQTLLANHEYRWCVENLTDPIPTAPGAWYEHPELRVAYAEPYGRGWCCHWGHSSRYKPTLLWRP